MTSTLTAKGRTGTITFDGNTVIISRTGVTARLLHGQSEKMLPIRRIAAVQLKPVSMLTLGYLQFTVPGEISNNAQKRSRTFDATKDENAITFVKKQEQDFIRIRDAIQSAIADL